MHNNKARLLCFTRGKQKKAKCKKDKKAKRAKMQKRQISSVFPLLVPLTDWLFLMLDSLVG